MLGREQINKDLFRNVNKEHKPKSNAPIFLMVGGIILFVVILVLMIMYPISKQRAYVNFVKDLSNDTTFAARYGSAKYTVDGETYEADTEGIYEVYQYFAIRDDIDYYHKPEEQLPGLRIEYGNGSILDIWPYENDESMYPGIAVLYTKADGKTYTFRTVNITYNSILSGIKQ